MTDERLPLIELLQKAGDGDFLRSVAEAVLQLLMEADVEGVIGAARHERTAERQTYRNGFRDRTLDTRLGTLQLRIPKLRAGPSLYGAFGVKLCMMSRSFFFERCRAFPSRGQRRSRPHVRWYWL